MKSRFTLFLFITFVQISFAQLYESNCDGADSIKQIYVTDVDYLSYFHTIESEDPYQDSINLSPSFRETFMDAMMAIYNLEGVPERDTVIDILNIHNYPVLFLDRLVIGLDQEVPWFTEWINGTFPTSNDTINVLIDQYSLEIAYYSETILYLEIQADQAYNPNNFLKEFEDIEGVKYVEMSYGAGDGDQIWGSIEDDAVLINFTKGWGDCPSGCIWSRTWKFKVDPDCTVELLDTEGSLLAVEDDLFDQVKSFPNPFIDRINIDGLVQFEYEIYNVIGQIMQSGKSLNGQIENVIGLESGPYIFKIKANDKEQSFVMIKS